MIALSPRALPVAATATAAALGAAYALSPMSVWCALAMGLFVRWAVRELPERERRWVVAVVLVGAALRVFAIAALFLHASHGAIQVAAFFGDEVYLKRRASWIANFILGVDMPSHFFSAALDPFGRTLHHYLLAYLQIVLGPIPYGAHLLNAALFVAAAVLLHRILRRAYGRAPALLGLVLLLFWPTLFIWSVSALKEPLLLFLSVLALAAAANVMRARGRWPRLKALGLAAAAMAAVWAVRAEVLAMVGGGFVSALAVRLVTLRRWVFVGALMLAAVGFWIATSRMDVLGSVVQRLEYAALLHRGHVLTTGHGYKVLDEHFYSDRKSRLVLTQGEAARYVGRALVAFVLVPLPWDVVSTSELAVVPQHVVWYLIVLLAVGGFVAGLKRDRPLTLMLAGYIAIGTAGIALINGNVGTLVRQRDKVVPFILCLGALGATVVVARLARVVRLFANRHRVPRLEPSQGVRSVYRFPAVNLVDGAAGLALFAILILGWYGYQRPVRGRSPVITAVEPRTLVEGTSVRVAIHGNGFDSAWGAYLAGGRPVEGEFNQSRVDVTPLSDASRVDPPAKLVARPEEPAESTGGRDAPADRRAECVVRDSKEDYSDSGILCGFVIKSPTRAELHVSDLEPGAYDLLVYDSTRVVARYASAFFVERARPTIALAIITARFLLPPEVASRLQPGARDRQSPERPGLPASQAEMPATLVSVRQGQPLRVNRSLFLGDSAAAGSAVELSVPQDVVPVEADFQAFMRYAKTGWENRGRTLKTGGPFSFETDVYVLRGSIVAIQ